MKHNVVDMEFLSKDVIDMIQSLDITGVSRVVADVFRITERESLTSLSRSPRGQAVTCHHCGRLRRYQTEQIQLSYRHPQSYVRCLP